MTKNEHRQTLRALKKTRQKGTATKSAAIKLLKEAGIMTEKGNLKLKYRTPVKAA